MDPDRLLLEDARRMDKEALVKIFDLYASPLYSYSLRLCGDPRLADNIVGDVFAKLLEKFASGNGPTSNLRSYLYEMAYHIIVDEARSSQRRAPLDVLTSLRPDPAAGTQGLEDQVIFELILQAIQHDLTDDQRHVIILRFLEDFSLRDTAAILGKDVGHVKVIQTRAITKLRKIFESKEMRANLALPRIRELTNVLST